MADGTVYIDTDVDGSGFDIELANLRKDIKRTEIQLDKLIEKQIRFVETGGNQNSRMFQGMEYDIEHARTKLDNLRTAETQLIQNTTMSKNAFEAFKRALKNFIPNVVKASGSLLKMSGKGVLNGLKKLGAHLKNIGKHSKNGRYSMLKMLKSALLIGTAMRALSAVMNGAKEGMNNLAQYSGETNRDLSLLKSSLTQLKNSFATAFAPILSVVTPILNSLINSLSKAMTYIGMFMASLTGKGTFTKAIEVQEDYAAGLDSSADSAKDAEKANKGYLSGLDEVTKFQDKDSSSGNGKVSPSEMFEEVVIDSPISNFADILRQKIGEGDWQGIGSILAQKVNNLFAKIDFSNIASSLSSKLKSCFDFAIGFIENVNWGQLGGNLWNGLSRIVKNVDWNGLVSRIFQFLGAAIGGAAALVTGFCKEMWSSIKQGFEDIKTTYFEPYMNEMGEFTIEGFFKGIWNMICDIGTWIKDHIFTPFITGFKNAFGIHSPSTVMEEMGTYIMQGLLNGINSLVARVTEIFANIKSNIRRKYEEMKSNAAEFGSNIFNTITGKFSNLKDRASNKVSELYNSLHNIWGSMGSNASQWAQWIYNALYNKFTNIKTKITQIFNSMGQAIRDSINKIIYFINRMISGVVDGINSMIGALNSLSFTVPDWVPGIGGSTFGFDIGYVGTPQIPYLATGAVIPPNAPFMAVMGDQKNGRNLETPENLLRQIVREESGGNKGGNMRFTAQINRRVLFDEFIEEAKLRQMQTGKNPLEFA